MVFTPLITSPPPAVATFLGGLVWRAFEGGRAPAPECNCRCVSEIVCDVHGRDGGDSSALWATGAVAFAIGLAAGHLIVGALRPHVAVGGHEQNRASLVVSARRRWNIGERLYVRYRGDRAIHKQVALWPVKPRVGCILTPDKDRYRYLFHRDTGETNPAYGFSADVRDNALNQNVVLGRKIAFEEADRLGGARPDEYDAAIDWNGRPVCPVAVSTPRPPRRGYRLPPSISATGSSDPAGFASPRSSWASTVWCSASPAGRWPPSSRTAVAA